MAKGNLSAVDNILRAAGGKLLRRRPKQLQVGKHVVVSTADDAGLAAKIRSAGHRVYKFELISVSIVRQHLPLASSGFDDEFLLEV